MGLGRHLVEVILVRSGTVLTLKRYQTYVRN